MADQKQNYSFTGDLSKINPAELPESEIESYKQTLEEQIQALKQRYEQPNWFKVAAGFAKPQLGGFLASLGSASEALGENVEQQRAQELPIAQMKLQVQQANMLLGQKQKQNDIFQQWKSSGKPMDATTYSRIMSLGPDTEVASAASKFYEGAKAALDISTTATAAMGKDPMMQLEEFTKFQLNPDVDEKQIQARRDALQTSLNAAKPPQIDQATWDSMSRYEKMETSMQYARAQREAGMGAEAVMQQQAQQAPTRLSLLGSIRDLALGVGISDIEKDGKKVTGQQQMATMLDYFGGSNPFEVLARAAADGKLGDKLADIDKYARQNKMSEQVRNQFQKLAKLLADNQVTLRNGAINPTDQFTALQQASSPNIGNTQNALVTLVDLLGHGEKNSIDKYRYVLDNKIPFRELGVDPTYLDKQRRYAEEHRRIATSNPLVNTPSWYNPAAGTKPPAPAAAPSAATSPSGTPKSRPNERTIGGKTYMRQPDGSWALKGQP